MIKFIVVLNNELWKVIIYLGQNVDELYQSFINKFLLFYESISMEISEEKRQDKQFMDI
jgi:hypothetical protein